MLCFWIIGFYTFQGFQGYKVCKFWPYRTISMKFTSFSIYEFVSNLFELRKGHVALSHLRVPLRVDLKRDPLDLMEFGPPRSCHTGSVLWSNCAIRFRSNGQKQKRMGSSPRLGFGVTGDEVRHWKRMAACSCWSALAMEWRTTCGGGWRTRLWCRGARLRLVEEGRGDWKWDERRWASGGVACFDLLRIRKRGKYQQMR
jgi:hypothetical protein